MGEYTAAVATTLTVPTDDEAAIDASRDRRMPLVAGGGRIDQELIANHDTRAAKAPRIDAVLVAVLVVRGPGDDEIAATVGRNPRQALLIGSGLIDQDFAGQRNAGAVIDA